MVIIASMSGILLGVIGFAVVQRVKAKRRAQAAVAFEAAQSELGLDETFEQVSLPMQKPCTVWHCRLSCYGWLCCVFQHTKAKGSGCSCI